MSIADLTLTDARRLKQVMSLVRLTPAEKSAFESALVQTLTALAGLGERPDKAVLLAPLERTKAKLIERFGAEYVADLYARLRR